MGDSFNQAGMDDGSMNEIKPNDLFAQLRAIGSAALAESGGSAAQGGSNVDFGALLKSSLEAVNERQQGAAELARSFELGDPKVDLTRVMVEMQKARVSFEALYQVRNKLVEAYREVMSMQV